MTTYTLFSDPHLGTKRAAHTTRASAERLETRLFDTALKCSNEPMSICAGDLFDKSFNDERVIAQGMKIADNCHAVLSGNHDETNREGTVTSLNLIAEATDSVVASQNLATPYFLAGPDGLYFVPHHASQKLFEQAMRGAAAHALKNREGRASVLFLHCNYNFDFKTDDNTLNLSITTATELLEAFDYIFIGHDHKPKTHLDGRVVILGNTHPTSFSDISDKFQYTLEITDEAIELSKELIWDSSERYKQIPYGAEIPDLTNVDFVDVIGSESVATGVEVAQFVADIWKAGPELLAVRNNVAMVDHLSDTAEVEAVDTANLCDRIAADLDGSDLLPLYKEIFEEVSQ